MEIIDIYDEFLDKAIQVILYHDILDVLKIFKVTKKLSIINYY